jgi:hypothetical protein
VVTHLIVVTHDPCLHFFNVSDAPLAFAHYNQITFAGYGTIVYRV